MTEVVQSDDFLDADEYSVIYTGALQSGFTRDKVAKQLAELFKQREDKLTRLLERSSVVLKRGLSKERAERYARAFVKAGMQVIVKSAEEKTQAPDTTAETSDGEGTSDGTLVPPIDTQILQRVERATEEAPTDKTTSKKSPVKASASKKAPATTTDSKKESVTAAAAKAALDPETLAKLIRGKLTPVKLSSNYRLGLLGVAATMILLPALYLALCAGVGYFIYWWLGNGWSAADISGTYVRVLLFTLPLTVAVILFFFMLKPLLAGAPRRETALVLTEAGQPLFFAFVNALCDRVGAKRPGRVQVDCDVNASASYTGGISGLLGGNLTLTVGTPLIAGMSTRELAGVLAHEFGHFSQGAGMRTSYLIRAVTFWFHRAVYTRDTWDERLEHYANNAGGGWFELGLMIAQGCIWLVRQLLAMLMLLGELVSRFMMRHMEFDADTYEAQIAGSKQFRKTSVRIRLLAEAYQRVCHDLSALWEDGKLVDDIPSAVSDKAVAIEDEINQQVESLLKQEQSSYFDTHPADNERIRAAEALKAPGMFRLELPATVLFEDFEALAKQSTRRFYVAELGISPTEQGLVDRASLQATADEARARDEALEAYARVLFMPERFLEPDSVMPHVELDDEARKKKLEKCVTDLRTALPDITAVVEIVRRLDNELTEALVQATVPRTGVQTRDIGTIRNEHAAAVRKLEKFEAILIERLAIGLAGWVKGLEKGDEDVVLYDKLVQAQLGFVRLQSLFDELHVGAMTLYVTVEVMQSTFNPQDGTSAVPEKTLLERMSQVESKIDEFTKALEGIDYPFDRAGGPADIFTHLRDNLPVLDSEDPSSIVAYAMGLNESIVRLHVRVMAALCHRAQEVETALDVAPIRIQLEQS